jgi:hypothetical protein
MSQDARTAHAAVGFRVKSGRAITVLVTGSIQAPQLLDRRVIELCDPAIPESRQPCHAGMGTLQTDAAKVERLRRFVIRATNRSVTELMRDYRDAGHRVRAAGLVVGSEIDPTIITNPHIRAHALEGQLFRSVLEDAVRSCGLPCAVFVERTVYARAGEILKRSEQDVKSAVAQLGRRLGGPWRSDEKTASLAAWLAQP